MYHDFLYMYILLNYPYFFQILLHNCALIKVITTDAVLLYGFFPVNLDQLLVISALGSIFICIFNVWYECGKKYKDIEYYFEIKIEYDN